MLRFMKGPILGVIAGALWFLNTLFWALPLLIVTGVKILLPFKMTRRLANLLLDLMATSWVSVNNFSFKTLANIRCTVHSDAVLEKNASYLVISNHQSWADIVVLGRVFNRKIPFFKFFLKKSLLYVPVLGMAWWALDYPFMERYTKEQLEKNPALKEKNFAVAKALCEKYQKMPVAIMNFVEGSRFSVGKAEHQESPFQNLLLPRAGGVASTLQILGKQFKSILDVTIVYPIQEPNLWKMLCGKILHIKVFITERKITKDLIGDYHDPIFRQHFQTVLNNWWEEKDILIDKTSVENQ
jgi:1-acyl-sn-glycerol-3-phosphate acyltransferase